MSFFGGFDAKSFLAFLTIWLVKNLTHKSAIVFKKAFFLIGGFSWRLKGRENDFKYFLSL
ncbi:hypothetical protein EC582_03960 [Helicobacter pylori]|nr:hypothetical protein EC582_03960 [Helicobacter pylori]